MKKFWIVLTAIAMLSLLCTLTVLAEANDGGVPAACEHEWETFYDNDAHWEYCSKCNAVQNRAEHSFKTNAGDAQHAQVCDCGRVKSIEDHNWVRVGDEHKFVCSGCAAETTNCVYNEVAYFNSIYHTHACSACGEYDPNGEKEPHREDLNQMQYNETSHWYGCVCGYGHREEGTHNFGDWVTDATHHWKECADCGAISEKAEHSGEAVTCQEVAVCECGVTYETEHTHTGTATVYSEKNAFYHTVAYSCCGEIVNAFQRHLFEDSVCTACDYTCNHDVAISGKTHTYADNGEQHTAICQNCGKGTDENHDWKNENGACVLCGKSCEHGENGALLEYKNADVEGIWKHWRKCTRCGYETEKENCVADNTLATCQSLAVCGICAKEFGEIADHDWKTDGTCKTEGCNETCSHNYVVEEYTGDGAKHTEKCNICQNEKQTLCSGNEDTATCISKAYCEKCKNLYGDVNLKKHDETCAVFVKDDSLNTSTQHTAYYTCTGDTQIEENHDWSNKDGVCKTEGCGYICINPDLQLIDDELDNNQHQKKCNTCGHIIMVNCYGGQATCLKKAECTDCGAEYGEYGSNHDDDCVRIVEVIPNNATQHNVYYTCKKDGEDQPIPTPENHYIDPNVGVCECGWHVVRQEEEQGGE